jgi:hypothetical protein
MSEAIFGCRRRIVAISIVLVICGRFSSLIGESSGSQRSANITPAAGNANDLWVHRLVQLGTS